MSADPVAPAAGVAAAPPAVETAGLTRRFGALTAVDGLTLSIPRATIFGLLGPNGAGKTTTLKMLTTLLPPSAGTARVAGLDVVAAPREVRRRIGYVPQLVSAEGSLTAWENLTVFARLQGVPRGERRERVREALGLVGLGDAADQVVKRFSGGMIRRLEIAQAVIHRPAVLLLDEPTVGLDPVARRTVWEHVRSLRERLGTTVLLTTHYMEEAEELCDAVAILHQGRVAALGSPAELEAQAGEGATLDDVFARTTGNALDTGGTYREVARTRRTARRLG
jgi:ABC-2 type transport system ATP-binding protein